MARLGNNPTSVLERAEQYGSMTKLYFPEDLATNRIMRFMSFTVSRIGDEFQDEKAMVCLPIPSNLTDSYSYQYTDAPFGPAYAQLQAGEYKAYAEALFKAGYQQAGSRLLSLLGTADASAIQRSEFGVVNPHLVNQFVGMGFKNHSLFFTLIAKNRQESENIAGIVEFFKYYSAPDFADLRTFTIPSTFQIAYNDTAIQSNTTSLNQFLPKFNSACYLTDMQVLYNGGGQPQFFVSGAPVEVQLSLNFRETEITTRTLLRDMGNTNKVRKTIDPTADVP